AVPPFLLFLDPARAIQLVIIISTTLSIAVLRGLLPAIAPWLLLRLALGSLVGLPLGLVAFHYADPILVRAAAGAMIFCFAILMAVSRRRSGPPREGNHWTAFAIIPGLDLAAGAVSGFLSALVGQPGPPTCRVHNRARVEQVNLAERRGVSVCARRKLRAEADPMARRTGVGHSWRRASRV